MMMMSADADDDDNDDECLKIQVDRLLDLLREKIFQTQVNNGAKCDYNWAGEGRKVQ